MEAAKSQVKTYEKDALYCVCLSTKTNYMVGRVIPYDQTQEVGKDDVHLSYPMQLIFQGYDPEQLKKGIKVQLWGLLDDPYMTDEDGIVIPQSDYWAVKKLNQKNPQIKIMVDLYNQIVNNAKLKQAGLVPVSEAGNIQSIKGGSK